MRHHITATLLAGVCALALGSPAAAEQPDQAVPGAPLSGQQTVRAAGDQSAPLTLTDAHRQAIIDAVARQDTRQATPKEFKAAEGADVPRTVDIHPLPRPLVYEMPELKDYMYAHLDRNIAIVDALAKKVVAVIALPQELAFEGKQPEVKEAALNAVGGLAGLSDAQRQAIYQAAGDAPQQTAPEGEALLAGAAVPANLNVQPLPPELAAQTPAVQGLHYARLQDGRLLLVDPQARRIAGVITQEEGAAGGAQASAPGGDNTGVGGSSPDPMREREKTGKPNAYSGPSTTK
jgi:hypothetical protein